jgi:hypothetical protein
MPLSGVALDFGREFAYEQSIRATGVRGDQHGFQECVEEAEEIEKDGNREAAEARTAAPAPTGLVANPDRFGTNLGPWWDPGGQR